MPRITTLSGLPRCGTAPRATRNRSGSLRCRQPSRKADHSSPALAAQWRRHRSAATGCKSDLQRKMSIATQARRLFTVAIWSAVIPSAIAQPAGDASQRPSFQPFRYDEDWRSLEDRSTHIDWLDPLKYIPLGRPNWIVTIGGEIRERFELLDHPNFGSGTTDGNGYFLQRYLLSSDFHFGPGVRFFGELQSGLENGRKGGPRPTDLDRLEVHQAFLDWKVFASDARALTIRVGRQEIGFGSGRLLSPAEGLNLRRSLDGARVTVKLGKVVWNMTALRLGKVIPGYFR